jgi:uncharacterized repeat protein (TIGR01451 family)
VTGVTATLSTSTTGVTIYDGTSTYGAIAPQGSAVGDTFLLTLTPTVPCGSAIDVTLSLVSNLGTTTTTFRLRVGAASGVDPVVTYTDSAAASTIVSNAPRGVVRQLTVADDFEIADLDFRIDSITHPAVGDLSVLLRSPGGIGTDLVTLIDGLNDLGGTAITNMVIDDDVAVTAANDMVQATMANAPYSKSWLPVYNSPWMALVNPALGADTVPSLSRFDGSSTKGTWSTLAADLFSATSGGTNGNGTFSSWSMLVTPVHFSCAAFSPGAAVTATKTVAGAFQEGGTVIYTATLTNNGTGNQGDNPGNEFTDVLPSGLTLVSATATSGVAVATIGTSTVSWNGSLAPLGGSVTVTISATVNLGTGGSVISNQGTVAFDADLDGTNEAVVVTDDPTVGGASDPTRFVVAGPGSALVSGTKTVTGNFLSGGSVVYTVVLTNNGPGTQADNPGDEFVDVLPSELELTGSSATSGTAAATTATRTVTWNGSITPGASVTITIQATINPDQEGVTVSNQGSISFDSNGDGANDATAVTDDPGVTGAGNSTVFVVLSGSFYSVAPCRLVDTRLPDGPLGGPALAPGQERTFGLAGQCNLPATAGSVALNVTVTSTGGDGFATLWPDDEPRPLASTINFSAGQTRANNAVVQVGSNGAIRVVAAAATHILIDVTGYFQ